MKTSEEKDAAIAHALKYAQAKVAKLETPQEMADQETQYDASLPMLPTPGTNFVVQYAKNKQQGVRKVESCVLAHTVSIRGTETRTVSAQKLDYKAASLEIFEHRLGLEISYTGTNTKRYSLIVPWSNVVEFRYSE